MKSNEKPRTQGTGHIHHLDDESINRNVSVINKTSATSDHIIGKSSPINTNEHINEIAKMLREQRERRDDAGLRSEPLACGCRDPLRCTCYTKRGA